MDDNRGSADYKREKVKILVLRAAKEALLKTVHETLSTDSISPSTWDRQERPLHIFLGLAPFS